MRAPLKVAVTLTAASVAAATLAGCGGGSQTATTSTSAPREPPPVHHFRSRPDLRPPPVQVLTRHPGAAPATVRRAEEEVAQAGPLIFDTPAGRLVPAAGHPGVADFKRPALPRQRPVLTWWRGRRQGRRQRPLRDHGLRTADRTVPPPGLGGDIHEFLLTPRNTALFTVYRRLPRDLARGGPAGPYPGGRHPGARHRDRQAAVRVAQRPVGLDESYEPIPKAGAGDRDYFHMNSIEDVTTTATASVGAEHARRLQDPQV